MFSFFSKSQIDPELLRYRREKLRFRLSPIGFLLPLTIMFSIFVIYPIVNSIWLSFHEWNGVAFTKLPNGLFVKDKEWIGLANYVRMFQDFRFLTSVKNNIIWLAMSILAPVGGLLLALLLNQRVKGIRAIKSLFFFPFVITAVVIGLMFSWFYNPQFGLLSEILGIFGLPPLPVLSNENLATFGIIGASLWPGIAYCMILYITGLTSMDPQVIEAGSIDGASGLSLFWHVVLPQLRPATFIATVVTIIGALRSFDLIAIMTGGGPYGQSYVLAYHMYQESLFNFNVGYGASLATFLFLIMDIYIVYFLIRIAKNERH